MTHGKDLINFIALVSDITMELGELAENKGMFFDVTIPTSLPRFYLGDANKVKMLLYCIGKHSIRTTVYGGVTIKIKAEKISASKFSFQFDVTDTSRRGTSLNGPRKTSPLWYLANELSDQLNGCISANITAAWGGTI